MIEISGPGYRIWSPHDLPSDQRANGNIDVHVYPTDGRHYCGTFFTLDNLAWLMDRGRETGECASGAYMWSTRMVIVRELTESNLRIAVEDLIRTGALESALERCSSGE